MEFAEISINDKVLFDKYLGQYNPQVSELTFTNLFMWRGYYKIRYALIKDFLCIISVPDKSSPFAFFPIGDFSKGDLQDVVPELKRYFNYKGWTLEFKRVAEEELKYLRSFTSSNHSIVYDRDNSDYVYSSSDLINLSGKKYDAKRNHINKFNKLYGFEYVAMDEANIDECHRIMNDWCSERKCEEHKGLYCEKLANTEVLNNFKALGCKGALIRVNDRFEAFTVGERLNTDTAVVHIEKANSKINGLYTLINQQFCEKEWHDIAYVNREQDLGSEGLRKAKLSYHPVKMVNKYSVVIG